MTIAFLREEGVRSWVTSPISAIDEGLATVTVVAANGKRLVEALELVRPSRGAVLVRWATFGDPIPSPARRRIVIREMEQLPPSFKPPVVFATDDGLISSCAEARVPLSESHLLALFDSRRTLLLVLREPATCAEIAPELQHQLCVSSSTIEQCLRMQGVLAAWQFFDQEPAVLAVQIFSAELEARRTIACLAASGARRVAGPDELPNFVSLS
jgi:hypothetical protein